MSNAGSEIAGRAEGSRAFDEALAELARYDEAKSGEEFDRAACVLVEMHPDARGYCRIARLYGLRGEPAKGLEVLDCGLLRIGESVDMLRLGAKLSCDVPDFERAILYHKRWADLPEYRASNLVAIANLEPQNSRRFRCLGSA